jgi:GntR family transcriptional regulator
MATCLTSEVMGLGPDDGIDHDAMLPPYRQLAEILKARVKRGDWQPGRPIASRVQLVQEYGIAHTTVARTIDVLVEEGVLVVVPRRGTYVAETAEGPGK